MTINDLVSALARFHDEQINAPDEPSDEVLASWDKRRAEFALLLAPLLEAAVASGVVEVAVETGGGDVAIYDPYKTVVSGEDDNLALQILVNDADIMVSFNIHDEQPETSALH